MTMKKPQPPGGPLSLFSQPLQGVFEDGVHVTSRFPIQVAGLISLCFPPQSTLTIQECIIRQIPKKFSLAIPPGIQEMDSILACVSGGVKEARNIHPACIPNTMELSIIEPSVVTYEVHDAYLLECVLSRTCKKYRRKSASTFSETLLLTRAPKLYTYSCHDHFFHTLLVYIPLAGIFYTTARMLPSQATSTPSLFPTDGYTPLPFSWL